MGKLTVSLFITISFVLSVNAQENTQTTTQVWDFMVRNTSRVQDMAKRFHVSEGEIRKYSDIHGKTVYPGKVIKIPVRVRPATWNPSSFNPNKAFLSREDARPQLEYEWNSDSLDSQILEDFILVSDIQADSVQAEKISKHVGRIDKYILDLNWQLDSIKNTEFAFKYDEKDMNSVLKRMEFARQRFYAQGPIGIKVDSLNDLKRKLGEEANRLRTRLSESEYLSENANYFEKNKEGSADMDVKAQGRSGDQIMAEAKYIESKQSKRLQAKNAKKNQTQAEVGPEVLERRPAEPAVEPESVMIEIARKKEVAEKTESLSPKSVQPTSAASSPSSSEEIKTKETSAQNPVAAEPITEKKETTPAQNNSNAGTNKSEVSENKTAPKTAAKPAETTAVAGPTPAEIAYARQVKKEAEQQARKEADQKAKQEATSKDSIATVRAALALKEAQRETEAKEEQNRLAAANLQQKKAEEARAELQKIETAKEEQRNAEAVKEEQRRVEASNIELQKAEATKEEQRKAEKILNPVLAETVPTKPEPVKEAEPAREEARKEPKEKPSATENPLKEESLIKKDQESVPAPTHPVESVKTEGKKKKTESREDAAPAKASGKKKNKEDKQEVYKRDTFTLQTLQEQNSTSTIVTQKQTSVINDNKAVAKKALEKEEDPLDKYTEGSAFSFRGLPIQNISVGTVKDKPRYLVPVDSNTRQKAELWLTRFKDEMRKNDFKKAEQYLRKSIDINPNNSQAWTYHAEMQAASGHGQDALKEYVIATSIDSLNARPFYKMALLYENSNNTDKAYEFYSQAIDVDSNYARAYFSRADLSVRLNDRVAAKEDYTRLIEVNKYFSKAYKERGFLKMKDRDYSGALADFNAYLDIEDPDGEVLYRRGIANVYLGKIIDGCNDFNASLQLKYSEAEAAVKKYCE